MKKYLAPIVAFVLMLVQIIGLLIVAIFAFYDATEAHTFGLGWSVWHILIIAGCAAAAVIVWILYELTIVVFDIARNTERQAKAAERLLERLDERDFKF